MAKITLAEAVARPPNLDRKILDSTTEEDIRRHMIEDGYDPDEEVPEGAWRVVRPPAEVRERLSITQARMAALIGAPLATWKNWEQGRTQLPPYVRVLLNILDREPEAALRALGVSKAA